MKKFHKTVTSPPYCFYEILIQKSDRISGTYGFLNKRYEIHIQKDYIINIHHIRLSRNL